MRASGEAAARILVFMTAVSAALIGVGLVMFLFAHAGQQPGDHVFSGEPKSFENLGAMVARALQPEAVGEHRSVAMIGIFLLLLTPMLRVLLTGLDFFRSGDKLYAIIGGIVLLVLAVGFFW